MKISSNEPPSSTVLPPKKPSLFLSQMLGDVSCERFFAQHYGRRAYKGHASLQALGIECGGLGERLINEPTVEVMMVKDQQVRRGPRPSLAEGERLLHDGFTWVLRDAERGDAGLARLGHALALEVHGALKLHVYRSTIGQLGFGWHCDAEEIFLVQAEGVKQVHVKRNSLWPVPLPDAIPTHLAANNDATPMQSYLLEPGDWLYIPAGHWHYAEPLSESMSISIGILTPSVMDALDMVVTELSREERWRRRLPPIGKASPYSDEERNALWRGELFALAGEVQRRLQLRDRVTQLFLRTGHRLTGDRA